MSPGGGATPEERAVPAFIKRRVRRDCWAGSAAGVEEDGGRSRVIPVAGTEEWETIAGSWKTGCEADWDLDGRVCEM